MGIASARQRNLCGNARVLKGEWQKTVFNMDKIAFTMKLLPGYEEEYKRRHAALWPELAALLKSHGVSDYSIFLEEDTGTLFAVQRQSGSQSSQDLGSNPVVQRWWAYMADIMETNPDNSPVSRPLTQVFHLD